MLNSLVLPLFEGKRIFSTEGNSDNVSSLLCAVCVVVIARDTGTALVIALESALVVPPGPEDSILDKGLLVIPPLLL